MDSIVQAWTGHRAKKRRAHSQSGRQVRRRMEITTTETKNKRKREHEAELIPGVDGNLIFGFPNSIITKLRYCTFGTLAMTSGARGYNVFSANSLYDPDTTGVGHQPMWFDTYAAIYDQYAVLGSKITVQFIPVSSSVSTIVGILGDDDSTVGTDAEVYMESNNGIHSCIGTIGSQPITLTNTFSPLEHFGVDVKDDGASATSVASNPTEGWNYLVWCIPSDASSTITINYKVEIEYTAKFAELKTPTKS